MLLSSLSPFSRIVCTVFTVSGGFLLPWIWAPPLIFLVILVPVAAWGKYWRAWLSGVAKAILPFWFFLFLTYGFFLPGNVPGENYFFIFTLNTEGLWTAFETGTKILVMVSSTLLLLISTKASKLAGDLQQRGCPNVICYVVLASLSLVPQLKQRAARIQDAQKARGLDLSGGFISRTKKLVPLVMPLVLGVLADVEERAAALELKGFNLRCKKSSLMVFEEKRWERTFRSACWFGIALMVILRIWI